MIEDKDPIETQEWLDALDAVVKYEGPDRAAYLLRRLSERAVMRDGDHDTVPQYDFTQCGKADAGRPVHGTTHSLAGALECAGHGHARER